jgi:hypothetical protein
MTRTGRQVVRYIGEWNPVAQVIGLPALALFVGAGSLARAAGWVYVGLYAGLAAIGAVVLLPRHSDLVVE